MGTDPNLAAAVLHSLRLKGRAALPRVASAVGADPEAARDALESHAAAGLAVLREGRVGGWMLTPDGRQEWQRWLDAQHASLETGPLGALYDGQFLELNRRFKQLCTRWQLAREDDVAFLVELEKVHTENLALVEQFGAYASRLTATYPPRFTGAFEAFRDGDHNALLRPLSDSYHDVWAELHEDLLLLLQREREIDD